MKRHIPGLHLETADEFAHHDGLFLVRVERARYCYHSLKPFFSLSFCVLKPEERAGTIVSGRLYSTPKAAWRLRWFLREFGYDTVLLEQDMVDERALLGLQGIIKVSHASISGQTFVNFDGFARADRWVGINQKQEATVDL
jgi:hypothetical protein